MQMFIRNRITKIPPLSHGSEMLQVFDQFLRHRDISYLPVVNGSCEPLGIIREYDLKEYAYAIFGREQIRHHSIREFVIPRRRVFFIRATAF